MKIQSFILSISLMFLVKIVTSTDLTVQEFGASGNYSSINAAISAAANGDRIIVIPKAGNAPWIENLVVSKSLTFISDIENGEINITGNIQITPTTVLEINFIGLVLSQSLSATTDGTGGTRTTVNIFNSNIRNISFDKDNYDVTIANCITGRINIRYGRLFGNTISSTNNSVLIEDEGVGAYPSASDSILIIGNRIFATSTSGLNPTAVFLDKVEYTIIVSNNFIKYLHNGILAQDLNASNHEFVNNTLHGSTGSALSGMNFINIPSGANVNIMNNLLDGSFNSSNVGITASGNVSGIVSAGFNYSKDFINNISGAVQDAGTNVANFTFSVNTITGKVITGNLTDVGHPAVIFTDLDLTTNDVGCYGGSLSMDNYFPVNDDNVRVYHLELPRTAQQGVSTVKIKAAAYDK